VDITTMISNDRSILFLDIIYVYVRTIYDNTLKTLGSFDILATVYNNRDVNKYL